MATLNEIYPMPYNVLSSDAFQQLNESETNYQELIKKIKDAISKVDKNSLKDLFSNIWSGINSGEFDGLAITKDVLGLLSAIPTVGPVFSAASTLLGLFWDDKTKADQQLFNRLAPKIEEMIQKDLLNYQEMVWSTNITELITLLNTTQVAINGNTTGTTMQSHITSVNTYYTAKILEFIPKPANPNDATAIYQVMGLPYYALFANFHVLFLRDAVVNATKWELSTSDQKFNKIMLQYAIQFHTDNIKNIYDTGLENISSQNLSKLDLFNAKRKYINGMAELVFDMVALWPTFDIVSYPTEVDLEFTRTLSSPILSSNYSSDDDKFPPIDYTTVFPYIGEDYVEIMLWGYDGTNLSGKSHWGVIKGLEQHYINGTIKKDGLTSNKSGSDLDGNYLLKTFPFSYNTTIIGTGNARYVDSTHEKNEFSLYYQDKDPDSLVAGNGGKKVEENKELAPAGYKLNSIYPWFNWGRGSMKHLNVYTPQLTPYTNIIGSAAISCFPAEKGYQDTSYGGEFSYNFEPINSANVLEMNNHSMLVFPFTNTTKQNYDIRIRYACKQDTQVYISLDNGATTTPIPGNITLPNTNNLQEWSEPTHGTVEDDLIDPVFVEGEYGKYTLATIQQELSIGAGNFKIWLHQIQDNAPIFIDHIEFVPKSMHKAEIQVDTHLDGISTTVWSGSASAGLYSLRAHDIPPARGLSLTFMKDIGNGSISIAQASLYSSMFQVPENFNELEVFGLGLSAQHISFDLILESDSKLMFTQQKDLENVTTQVNNLFASSTHDTLTSDISDYWIEQVVMKVDALSDEVFGKEKKALRKLVNQAKRLSKARNLLVGGNFDQLDAWYMGRDVVKVSDHELFKSDHVLLPPPTLAPSYIFQKVEESKLKPNTRYTVSGFIAHGEDVELIVSRYGQEIQKVMQVPYGEALPLTSGSGSSCCIPVSTVNGKPADPHFFSYNIDVGSLETEANLGIEFGLRIVEPTGMARVSNLEILEDRALTAKEIRQVQRAEKDWRQAYDQERTEVTALLQPVLNQVNALYENENWNGPIRSGISYHDLENIVLPTLPKLRHWFMTDRMGEHGIILSRFQEALTRAYTQLEGRTLLHNGHFTTDLTSWTSAGDAHHTTLEDGKRVLRLPDWSSSATQTVEIEDFNLDQEYQLVVHARGEGTVTLQHGEEGENVEGHSHDTNSFTTSASTPVTFETNQVTVEITSENGEFLVDHIALVEVPEQDNTGNPTIVSSNANSGGIPYRL